MSNHSIIEHRANYHFIKVEEDYVHICSNGGQYPQCKAVILSVLEHWINDKKSKGQDVHIYMTYPEWIDNMYGLFRRSTIIACLTDLEREKLISRRPCKRHGKDTYEYTLNIVAVQEKLKQLPERTEKYTRPNLNASKFKRVQKQTGVNSDGSTDVNLDGSEHEDPSKSKRNIDSITYTPSNIDSNIATSLEVALHTSNVSDFEAMRKRKTEPCLPVVHLTIDTASQYRIATDGYEKDADEEPTVKMPAIPKQTPGAGAPLSSVVNPPVGDQDDAASGQAVPVLGTGTTPAQRSGAVTSHSPSVSTGAVQAAASVYKMATDDQVNGVNKAITKRSRAKKPVTQAKPVFTLTEQQQAFWTLWCSIWFNVDIPPSLNETAYSHIKILAPFIVTTELLDSLAEYTRKDLADSQGIKRKRVQLGNLVYCYPGWKQSQQQGAKNISKNGTDLNVYGLQALLERQQKAI